MDDTKRITNVKYSIKLEFLDQVKPTEDTFGIAIGFSQEQGYEYDTVSCRKSLKP